MEVLCFFLGHKKWKTSQESKSDVLSRMVCAVTRSAWVLWFESSRGHPFFWQLKLKKRKWAEPMREGCSPGIIRTYNVYVEKWVQFVKSPYYPLYVLWGGVYRCTSLQKKEMMNVLNGPAQHGRVCTSVNVQRIRDFKKKYSVYVKSL